MCMYRPALTVVLGLNSCAMIQYLRRRRHSTMCLWHNCSLACRCDPSHGSRIPPAERTKFHRLAFELLGLSKNNLLQIMSTTLPRNQCSLSCTLRLYSAMTMLPTDNEPKNICFGGNDCDKPRSWLILGILHALHLSCLYNTLRYESS